MPIDRFELTHANRKVLGLDRGPAGSPPQHGHRQEDPGEPVEVGHHADGVAADAAAYRPAFREAIEVEGGKEAAVVGSANEPPSGMEQFDERGDAVGLDRNGGDAVSLDRNEREEGDDLNES